MSAAQIAKIEAKRAAKAAKQAAKQAGKKDKKKGAGLGVGCAELRQRVAPAGSAAGVEEVTKLLDPFRTDEVRMGRMLAFSPCSGAKYYRCDQPAVNLAE